MRTINTWLIAEGIDWLIAPDAPWLLSEYISMIDCISELIGLTDKTCDCYENSRPADYNTSTSGRFITDADYGIPVQEAMYSSTDCGENSFWDVLAKAKSQAYQNFETDLQVILTKYKKKNVTPFSGYVGRKNGNGYASISTDFAGVQLRPYKMKDVNFIVTKIWSKFEQTGTIDLTLTTNNEDFVDPGTISVGTVAGTWTATNYSLTLPFFSKSCERVSYNFQYDTDAGNRPFQNDFYCCSYRPQWIKHLQAGGFRTNNVDTEKEYALKTGNGLVFEGYFSCDNLQWICELEQLDGGALLDVIAGALVLNAATLVLNFIASTGKWSQWTTLQSKEALYSKRNAYNKKYTETIHWLSENLPREYTDCYTCQPSILFAGGR